MLGFECELQPQDLRMVQVCHNLPLVGHHAFLAAFEQAFFLHELERVEVAGREESGQEYSGKPAGPNASDDLKVREGDGLLLVFFPDWLDLQNGALEHSEGLAGLKVVVLEDVGRAHRPPGLNASVVEIRVFCFNGGVLRISCSKRVIWVRSTS